MIRQHTRGWPDLLALAALLVLSPSCKSPERKKEESACNAAIHAGRLAAKGGKLDEAREQLAVADRTCPELRRPYADELREQIATKERQLDREAALETAEQRRRREHPVFPFMEWVHREAPAKDKESAGAHCYPNGDPSHGWCDVTHEVVKGAPFTLRFWQREPDTFRFSVTLKGAAVCDDLDDHRVVRSWKAKTADGLDVSRTHCELLSKGFRGLAALITTSDAQTGVQVFSRGYLDKDAAFADMLRTEGR